MAKKKVEKKKGPKGKKARAAAKLERQWGEHVDAKDIQAATYRRGKSRSTKSKKENVHMHVPGDEADEEEVPMKGDLVENTKSDQKYDDEEDDEGYAPQEDALCLLLKSIKKKSKRSKRVFVDEEDGALVDEESDDGDIVEEDQQEGTDESEIEEDEATTEKDDDGQADQDSDPFADHFNREPLPENEKEISDLLSILQEFHKVPTPFLDDSLDLQLSAQSVTNQLKSSNLLDQNASSSKLQKGWNQLSSSLFACNRKLLKEGWKKANKQVLKSDPDGDGIVPSSSLSSLQSCLYPPLASYADILLTNESRKNRDAIHNTIHLHLLNHVLTSRSRIQRNNKRIKELEKNDEVVDDTDKYRDQGYTRPSVLVLLPTRGTCHSFFNSMMHMLGDSVSLVENLDRFDEEYGPAALEEDPDEDEAAMRRRKAIQEAKGPGWNELFGDEQNADDDFKFGFSMTPKVAGGQGKGCGVAVKMYTNTYRSDIILASPLALKMAIESEDEDGKTDSDFLSSIEICLVARSEVLYMQNWDHVHNVLNCLNQQPKKNNGTDYGRVRQYLLAGQAKFWRQTIFTSTFCDPMILSTFKRHAKCWEGALKLRCRVPVDAASLNNVIVRVKQVFQRISCTSFANQGSDRLQYFEDRVLPQILRSKQKHTMIFIPSYFDFVSVRNLLLKKEADFVSVTEYARVSEISRGRARFLQGRKAVMLYTGRAHYFARHAIKGVRHLVFFGLPERPDFYSGLVNELNKGLNRDGDDDVIAPTSVLALFTKYEAHALERIVGKQHCDRMIKGEKQTYMFVS
jgi:U3 small nucleolar RNA-associated protein 25